MSHNSRVRSRQALGILLLAIAVDQITAANMRSFIEAVRRRAPVVYVGSVKEVQMLERTKFDLKTRAVVDVLAVVRSPGPSAHESKFDYSSYDDKTPILAGGPQYQLRPGEMVVVFTTSFENTNQPGYLLHGSREELLQRVTALRDGLSAMTAEQLKTNEINEEDRRVQLGLYEKLCGYLQSR